MNEPLPSPLTPAWRLAVPALTPMPTLWGDLAPATMPRRFLVIEWPEAPELEAIEFVASYDERPLAETRARRVNDADPSAAARVVDRLSSAGE